MARYPQRIVCLSEETTETLYLLGCGDRVVGISGFTMRPPEARLEKPKVSTFLEAKYQEILDLRPDLVLTFSDLQADIVRELLLRGVQVVAFNQRSVEEILQTILILGGIVGKSAEAEKLVREYEKRLENVALRASGKPRPKVYFEEWGNPLITGIRWVSELIEIAGGEDIFVDRRDAHHANGRIVQPDEVIRRNPDIVIGSWCGRPFKKDQVIAREGWSEITAVKQNRIFEIRSTLILQPGPAALSDGLDELVKIIHATWIT